MVKVSSIQNSTNPNSIDTHKIPLKELYLRLGTSKSGLESQDVAKRRKIYGYNVLEKRKKMPFVFRLGKHFINYFAILLWIGSFLSFFAGYSFAEHSYIYIGIALAGVVILNSLFTFIQEYRSERIMEGFRKMLPAKIDCLRNGQRKEIPAKELVPGDIIYLQEGDKIPADGRLIEENALKVDNSSLTGESEPQLRKLSCTHDNLIESRNMVFSGTLVQAGNGVAVVSGAGMNTQIGRIIKLTKSPSTVLTPLRREIRNFVNIISAIAIVLGITFFIISLLIGDKPIVSLVFAIGIIVANVPEGLLPTVTLALSIAARKIARKKALMRDLESVETLGSTTVICTDKTGTLTENRIAVSSILINLEEKSVSQKRIKELKGFEKMLDIAILCNNARMDAGNEYHGDPTEGALLLFGGKYVNVKHKINANKRVHESPFDSKTKRMISVNKNRNNTIAYLKGAPENVLEKCSYILINNRVEKLTKKHREEIVSYQKKLASRGERVLGLAYKDSVNLPVVEKGFIFVALIGMVDPIRKEIPGAIAKCKKAGIKVIMITGDYSITAEAVARECGMVGNGSANIMTGSELDTVSEKQLQGFLGKDNIVLARISPSHKLKVVKALQAVGEVVTVTGDGVNDAPALKNADMGVAMGIAGTEVAKEAANMVLLNDNFATIVSAVEEGRIIYSNIKRFITYILTSNIPEILPFIVFVLLGVPLPLTVVLILAIDLGTDLLPALGLGVEKAEIDVMKVPPRSRKERLLDFKLLFRSYGIVGMFEAVAGFFAYFAVLLTGGWRWGQTLATTNPLYLKAVSAFFASIILCQIANVLICRTNKESVLKKGLFSNRLVLVGIISELILLAVIIYNPLTHPLFGTTYLSPLELLLALPFAITIFFGGELVKWLIRKKTTS